MKISEIKIVFINGNEKIIDKNSIKNFYSLINWMNSFNNNDSVATLTLSGRDLGSTFSVSKYTIKSIEPLK
ncbi:hypothetical protein CHF27_010745 [Romboutsia maritimum]|uniref:Uncharacterized protein n=1 Tax=Romboutsia maritimum TaxID=2020948 RepID=A0A371IR65_9FIRM|nr:hypothetical protein [Romboutsia maritimum]RDY22975.1 hypothetical protein CHF27_010745 [Romboutsia maritimum]